MEDKRPDRKLMFGARTKEEEEGAFCFLLLVLGVVVYVGLTIVRVVR